MMSEQPMRVYTADNIKDFSLDNIFDCGQCFRWEKTDDGMYAGTAYGKTAVMEYDPAGETLRIHGASEEDYEKIWRRYLDLDRDYTRIKQELSCRDAVIAKAVEFGPGIRILNQDKWETLISFIISQNNNIPRIKKCINSLAETLGSKAGEAGGKVFYNLPSPEVLAGASAEDLEPCRLGYRTKYLIETAGMVAEEGLDSLERLGTDEVTSDEAFERLQRYSGVGPKVANCIALFSLGRTDRFPIDVWVKKVMHQLYGIPENNMKAMAEFAEAHFGEYGGIAQQYLFYYITHNTNNK